MERKETSTFWRLRYCSEAPVLAASMRAGGAHPGQALLICAPEARAPGVDIPARIRARGTLPGAFLEFCLVEYNS